MATALTHTVPVSDENRGTVFGVAEDSERTYIEVKRLGDIIASASNALDWAMLGMILTAVTSEE